MEKFDSRKHLHYFISSIPFSYFSTPIYLDFGTYIFLRNNENIFVSQDIFFPHEFPAVLLPKNKLNWQNLSFTFATETDIKKIEKENIEIKIKNLIGEEYFYKTNSLIEPRKEIVRRINQFKKLYKYRILKRYPKEKIIKFYEFWKSQKDRKGDTFEEGENFFFFCLNNLNKYSIKQIYIEVNKRIVGLAWGVFHPKNGWVGLHLKVDYKIKGLSRFLHHERARLFSDIEMFSLGTGAREPGIVQFKEELSPIFKKKYYYLLTGKKIISSPNRF